MADDESVWCGHRNNGLSPLQKAQAELMSLVSESAYCAGWMHGTEEATWRLMTGELESWGNGFGPPPAPYLAALKALSDITQTWIVWDNEANPDDPEFNCLNAVPLDEFARRMAGSRDG